MKPVKISLSVQRNLGNYETASMIVSYEVNPGEDITECFKRAKKEINEAFIECFVKKADSSAPESIEKNDRSGYNIIK